MLFAKFCLFLALVFSLSFSAVAATPKDARNLAVLMGYAGACSKKLIGVDHDEEAKPFAEKAFRPYLDMGKPLLTLVNRSLSAGIKEMEKTNGKFCPAVLRRIIARYEALGFSANVYKKALIRLGNEGLPDKKTGKSPFEIKIAPGHYVSQGKPRADLFLNQDGTGNITGPFSSRLKWEPAGARLNIFFVDDNNERSRLIRATILTASSFELEGRRYQLESGSKISTYAYAEPGFAGTLTLQKKSGNGINFGIETVNTASQSSCNLRGICQQKGKKLLCLPADAPGKDSARIIIGNYPAGQLSVSSTFASENFCSSKAQFTGRYQRRAR